MKRSASAIRRASSCAWSRAALRRKRTSWLGFTQAMRPRLTPVVPVFQLLVQGSCMGEHIDRNDRCHVYRQVADIIRD